MSGVNQSEMLVGLDIGTSKVVAVVAEITSEEKYRNNWIRNSAF